LKTVIVIFTGIQNQINPADVVQTKSILIIVPAENFNEQEFLGTKNTLERNGLNVFIGSDANTVCTGTQGMKVKADVSFFNIHVNNFAGIVFTGGPGVLNYWDNNFLWKTAGKFCNSGKLTAAICSAPVILARAGLLNGKEATCFPKDKDKLEREGAVYIDRNVVVAGNIITAQGPHAAVEFGMKIAELLKYGRTYG